MVPFDLVFQSFPINRRHIIKYGARYVDLVVRMDSERAYIYGVVFRCT